MDEPTRVMSVGDVDNVPMPLSWYKPGEARNFVCTVCGRKMLNLHGLNIHLGKAHLTPIKISKKEEGGTDA